jgi:hypothetical protein
MTVRCSRCLLDSNMLQCDGGTIPEQAQVAEQGLHLETGMIGAAAGRSGAPAVAPLSLRSLLPLPSWPRRLLLPLHQPWHAPPGSGTWTPAQMLS